MNSPIKNQQFTAEDNLLYIKYLSQKVIKGSVKERMEKDEQEQKENW